METRPAGSRLPADIQAALDRHAGRLAPFAGRIVFRSETSSTNDEAMSAAADGAPEGTTIVATSQTAGRGRQGRRWFSPPEAGLYVSVVLRPGMPPRPVPAGSVVLLTLVAGVALAEAVRRAAGLAVELKWPNDLVVRAGAAPGGGSGWRKLGGILTEASGLGTAEGWAVVGFGVNLLPVAWPDDLPRATSIEEELGRPAERGLLLAEALAALASRCDDLREGRSAAVLDRWRELSPLARGFAVRWTEGGRERLGHTSGVDLSGALLVETEEGPARIVAGEVMWDW